MLEQMGIAAKAASCRLVLLPSCGKNRVLEAIADELEAQTESILSANIQGVRQARANGPSEAMLDRLALIPARLKAIADDVHQVCNLADPVGQATDGSLLDNGLRLERRRASLGVIGAIYEARPNATVDAALLCLETDSVMTLHGGKEAYRTSAATVAVIQKALEACGLPTAVVQSTDSPGRALAAEMLQMDRHIGVLIPRGDADLHKLCRGQSTIPVVIGGTDVCHIYVDDTTEIAPVLRIIVNAKTQYPSTCNTVETLLVHQDIAGHSPPTLGRKITDSGVTLCGDEAVIQVPCGPVKLASLKLEEPDNEFLSLDPNVVVAGNMDGAVAHIREYGTQHLDAILTRTLSNANRFANEVDSSAAYANTLTHFTDGGQLGLGAEMTVSMQKLHACDPMELEALTTYKWIDFGDDVVRV